MQNKHVDSLILLAEDEPVTNKMITQCLVRSGYRGVESVKSGNELVEALASKKIDLVISDNLMPPGPTGVEIYKDLLAGKLGETNVNTPFIFLSANLGIQEELIDLGVSAFYSKPIHLETLFLAINTALGI